MGSLDPLRRRLRQRAERSFTASTHDVGRALGIAAPRDTGALARAITVGPTRASGARFTADISVAPRQRAKARYNEFGTRPHVIRPRRAKALRFRSGGRIRFARVVHHPGTKAKPWFYATLARWPVGLRRTLRSTS